MSGVDEPPTKMSKYEEYLDTEGEECMEEGQEEWLSEGVLTDDDYNPAMDQDKTDSNINTSQEDNDTTPSQENDMLDQNTINNTQNTGKLEENIEETLNSLDGKKDLPDELDAFLIRKIDGKVLEAKVKEDTKIIDNNDGNDTDDLLRMLGEGDQKAKKKTLKLIKNDKKEDPASSDDDEFIYERNKVKTLKLAKNVIIKRAPTKAVPEDMSDGDDETDQSTDDGSTVQRMFEVKKKPHMTKIDPPKKIQHVIQQVNSKKMEKPDLKVTKNFTPQKSILKSTVSQSALKSVQMKPQIKLVEVKTPAPFKPLSKPTLKSEKQKSESEKQKTKLNKESTLKDDFDEIINEEEFLEDDDIDLDEEEFGEDSEGEDSRKQRIMRPERMDEEVPSDAESHSEGGSLYDELPSSESEDLDDWFTLDIRAERAGDYLPLLGSKARELLLEERRRVSGRVATLRQSLSALTDSARRQADQLRSAAMALAEIDDTLKAA